MGFPGNLGYEQWQSRVDQQQKSHLTEDQSPLERPPPVHGPIRYESNQSEERSGSPHRNRGLTQIENEGATNTRAGQIEGDERPGPHTTLHLWPQDPEKPHVQQNVCQIPVQEHDREESPPLPRRHGRLDLGECTEDVGTQRPTSCGEPGDHEEGDGETYESERCRCSRCGAATGAGAGGNHLLRALRADAIRTPLTDRCVYRTGRAYRAPASRAAEKRVPFGVPVAHRGFGRVIVGHKGDGIRDGLLVNGHR